MTSCCVCTPPPQRRSFPDVSPLRYTAQRRRSDGGAPGDSMSERMLLSRRHWLQAAFGSTATVAMLRGTGAERPTEPKSLTAGALPITPAEHRARLERLQALMQERHVPAFIAESGA